MNPKELREKRVKAINDARKIVEIANAEKRQNLNDEERARFDAFMSEADSLDGQIKRLEKLAAFEKSLDDLEVRATDADVTKDTDGEIRTDGADAETPEAAKKAEAVAQRDAFRNYLTRGASTLTPIQRRALQVDDDTGGGFMAAPQQFVAQIIKAVDDAVFLRGLATVMPVNTSDSLGVPSLDTDLADAEWTGEITAVNEDTAMRVGKRELKPQPLSKLIKISRKLLRTSAIPADQLVRERLAYRFGVSQEKGFLTGTGANQPLGVFTASASGISTGRDVSTDNTTTAMTIDGLKNAKYALKGAYWRNAQWVFHRDAVKQIAKLKDANNQYLWQASTIVGEPDRLLNFPVNMSEFAPNTFTTGLYVGILGDFSKYWIAESLGFAVQVLFELYAATNQVGYIGRAEVDGMPVLEEAFSRVTLA